MTSKAIRSRKSRLNRRIIREKDRKKRNEFFIFFIILVLISIPILLYLRNRIEYVRYQYEIEELKSRKQILIKNAIYLEAERSYLESPRMIEDQARRDLYLKEQGDGGCLVVVRVHPDNEQGKHLLTESKSQDAEQAAMKAGWN
ncbi:MAG: hypothetical protein AB1756_03725 [Acidobacteriota bacterium]